MRILQTALPLLLVTLPLAAQPEGTHYDETRVPAYTLPDPLHGVRNAKDWPRRRAEILELFRAHMFGRSPAKPQRQTAELINLDTQALSGKAVRKILNLHLEHQNRKLAAELLIYLPAQAKGPVPVFLGLNFSGNHAVTLDPAVPVSKQWMRGGAVAARGATASRWPIEKIIERGYGVATLYYGDFDPDFDDGFANGVHALMGGERTPESWGAIAGWAWGLSRALDHLETDKDIDSKKVAVLGHSRLGKAALWAGAEDPRFSIVISNNSGCGGAALSRRAFGETVKRINTSFPHWFSQTFRQYNGDESALPIDQHMLIALMAPRPVYIASAAEDLWADPKGEFLSGVAAGPVYRLLGLRDLGATEMPVIHKPLMQTIGYHIREGKHDVTLYDWERFMDFAGMHWRNQ
ncbi:MAG: acetylxylan esterase [Acidimicrobiia bacterium]|nr:acetylxylan esterase [Acidimicrobiia bacterium]